MAGASAIGADDRILAKERASLRIGGRRSLDVHAVGCRLAHGLGIARKKQGRAMGMTQGLQQFRRSQLFWTPKEQERRNITGRQGLFDHRLSRFRSYPRRND